MWPFKKKTAENAYLRLVKEAVPIIYRKTGHINATLTMIFHEKEFILHASDPYNWKVLFENETTPLEQAAWQFIKSVVTVRNLLNEQESPDYLLARARDLSEHQKELWVAVAGVRNIHKSVQSQVSQKLVSALKDGKRDWDKLAKEITDVILLLPTGHAAEVINAITVYFSEEHRIRKVELDSVHKDVSDHVLSTLNDQIKELTSRY